jgi:arylformamidase
VTAERGAASGREAVRHHDLTRPVRSGMPVFPGDPPCTLHWAARIDDDGVNVAALGLGSHTGTHVDAPFHLLAGGARVGEMAVETFIGPAQLLDAREVGVVGAPWLEARLSPGCARLLLRTGAWTDDANFPTAWTPLDVPAAELLVARGVRLLGTDAPSPDAAGSEQLPVHRVLLGAGVAVVENLFLDHAPFGTHQLIALPLRLVEADASPLRAVLVER